MELNDLLKQMVGEKASDLIIKSGGVPAVRVNGKIRFLEMPALTIEETRHYCESFLTEEIRKIFEEYGEADAAYHLPGAGRFRINIFRRQGELGVVFRHIKDNIPSFAELNLPSIPLQRLSLLPRGLVLITGVTGSGKSTTIASMIQYINTLTRKHIITIEDPIEYQYYDKQSVISQREIGLDTEDFATALKYCMRQSPDVIVIGEMRDKETMEAAINAAETGHLVLSTLHTVNAVQTIERIINLFPPDQYNLIRMQLSLNLEGVVAQRLLTRIDAEGRIPSIELMFGTPLIRELIAEGKTKALAKAIDDEHSHYGTQTFNQALCQLYAEGKITMEEARSASDNPEDLELQIRGIRKGGDMSKLPAEVDTDKVTKKKVETTSARIKTGSSQYDLFD
jgi:twitching motility protein PilT